MSAARALELPVAAADGHRWALSARIPETPAQALLWLPALGVAAKHYLPFAEAVAACGVGLLRARMARRREQSDSPDPKVNRRL